MTLIRNGKPLLLYAYYHITNNISNNEKVSLSAKALLSFAMFCFAKYRCHSGTFSLKKHRHPERNIFMNIKSTEEERYEELRNKTLTIVP